MGTTIVFDNVAVQAGLTWRSSQWEPSISLTGSSYRKPTAPMSGVARDIT